MTTPRPAAPTVLAKTATARALLFEYQQGEGLPPHTHAGQIVVVAVLSGQLQLTVDGQVHTLGGGEVTKVQTSGYFSSLALQGGTRVLVTLLNE
ncbi:cupin domain-containing protein [Deinococcus sp. VB343]|uniref:Cupin domain-containing protein n=1 Tax=Deinococcus sp. VB142 TaxID=3112952 RepID=A0AAU6Q6Z5_9DEIO